MPEVLTVALVTAVLLAVNGLYVAAEFAIIGARPTRMQQLADGGNLVARAVRRLLRDPGRQDAYFATSQVGITLASLGLGMYGEHKLVELVEPRLDVLGAVATGLGALVATVLAVGLLTFLHVVLGEMVPKSVALRHPEAVALRLHRPMQVSRAVFGPFVWVMNRLGAAVLWVLRVPPPRGHEGILSPEELEMVIEESTEGGLMPAREGQILTNIMDFSDRAVHEVMTPRTRIEAFPVTIEPDTLAARLAASGHTRFPVYAGDLDHIVGVLHLKDFIRWRIAAERRFDLAALARPVRLVPELMPVETLLETFRRERRHVAIVMDEYGGTAGLVSLEDLIEEVVGEVRDEFDVEVPPVERLPDGSLRVAGEVQLDDLGEWLELPAARPDVATVGGLILTLLGRPAGPGDTVRLGAWRFTVRTVSHLAIGEVLVTPDGSGAVVDGAAAPLLH